MKRTLFGGLAFLGGLVLIASPAISQPPGDREEKGNKGNKGGREGKGRPPKFGLGQVLPPHLRGELNLTPEQEKEIAAIEAEVKTKLEKILTDEQKKTLENHRPPGFGGPGGAGGPGQGGPRQKGAGRPGQKGGDQPDRPPFDKN